MLVRDYKHNINILLTYSYYNMVLGIFETVDFPCDVWTMYLTFVAAGVHFLIFWYVLSIVWIISLLLDQPKQQRSLTPERSGR